MSNLKYSDLHAHIAALEKQGLLLAREAADQQGHRDARAGALAIPRRHSGGSSARRSCSRTSPTARAAATTCRWRSGILASNQEIYSVGIGCDVADIKKKWDRAEQHQIEPVMVDNPACQEIVVSGRRPRTARQRRRRPADPDLDAGLRQRALCVLLDVHHQGPGHRPAEHRQLPRDGEKPDPDGDEPGDRAQPGHPRALAEIQGARREDAGGADARRARRRSPSPRCTSCPSISTSSRSPAGWSARRSASARPRPST